MSHPDRTADRPSYLCAAYGCPMLGTMSDDTGGGNFVCHVHKGCEPGQVQAITVEINHNVWLANAIRDIRCRARNPNWRQTFERINHDLVQSRRKDLMQNSNSLDDWMIRLEVELLAVVKAGLPEEHKQQPMAM
jgi:hypothetical protein